MLTNNIEQYRKSNYKILPEILNRWSPRAMSGEGMKDDEIMTLFEAARWAPSSYNEQPWKFLYAKRDTENWDLFMDFMVEFNQQWAKNASLLIVIISSKKFLHNATPNVVHSFDAGSAWENLALQAASMGLVAHGMAGFDYEKAKKELNVPDDFSVEAMVAVGKIGKKEDLPEEMQQKEVPSDRKPLSEIIVEGKFL
jgi:nitroreductase